MSLQYYPHEDMQIRPGAHPEGLEAHGRDYGPIAIINLVLALSGISFAADGGTVGALVMLGLLAGFNALALTGRR